ncbi:hypothetical protein MKEN_00135400 [Mycena kentingensis (nom. inval.)]|nr:hypothetical protein MKEN_00135400 [Mycena kentingensis (nom. inval.)]
MSAPKAKLALLKPKVLHILLNFSQPADQRSLVSVSRVLRTPETLRRLFGCVSIQHAFPPASMWPYIELVLVDRYPSLQVDREADLSRIGELRNAAPWLSTLHTLEVECLPDGFWPPLMQALVALPSLRHLVLRKPRCAKDSLQNKISTLLWLLHWCWSLFMAVTGLGLILRRLSLGPKEPTTKPGAPYAALPLETLHYHFRPINDTSDIILLRADGSRLSDEVWRPTPSRFSLVHPSVYPGLHPRVLSAYLDREDPIWPSAPSPHPIIFRPIDDFNPNSSATYVLS